MPVMASLTLQGLRKHTALIPLILITGAGMVGAGAYLVRLAVTGPEVCWDKKNNPNPWEKYATKQYKFLNVGQKYVDPRPKFE